MTQNTFLVATLKRWNIQAYHDVIKHYPGRWQLITSPGELTVEMLETLQPNYIFFPHWSHIVSEEILNRFTCIGFHETDLPYGRGGSPIQNLIASGHHETVISAIRMNAEIDAGDIYLKRPLSLQGLGEEIYIRAAHIVAAMIRESIDAPPRPLKQQGTITHFQRRQPQQSEIPATMNSLMQVFDHIRMLDADGYPPAYIEHGEFKLEFSRPSLKTDHLITDVRVSFKKS